MVKVNKREVELRMARFERVCREAGVKLTPQRRAVFREVAGCGSHPDAEAVYRGVRARIPSLSLDTVYRTLWLLSDLGIITTLGPSRERTRFDANLTRHHHFVCNRCGMTRDFYSDAFNDLKLPDAVMAFGETETARVEVRGVCTECAAMKEKNKKNRTKKARPGS